MKIWASERRGAFAASVLVGLLASAPLSAQTVDDSTRNAARELASQAAGAYEKGDYERARDLYHRAYALLPAPTLSLREARALDKLGKLVEAVEAYVRTSRTQLTPSSPEAFRQAVQSAEDELAKLRPRVPKLEVSLDGADPASTRVTLDGKAIQPALIGVAQPVNPGTHEIEAITDGKSGRATITLAEGERKAITVKLTDDPNAVAPEASGDAPPEVAVEQAPSPEADRGGGFPHATLGWVSLGVGAAGLGAGVVTGLMATSKHSSAEDGCPDGKCPQGSQAADDMESFRTLRTVSTIGYAVGLVGVAAGVTLLITAPSKPSAAHVSPFIGVGSAGVTGRF